MSSLVSGSMSSEAVELVDRVLERRERIMLMSFLLDRGIVGVFPVELGLVGGLGHVLFLGLVLLLIRFVCVLLVIPEVTNELEGW